MNIRFNIEYYAYTGEQVAINIIGIDGTIAIHQLMTTQDNAHWTYEWTADGCQASTVDYYYTIKRGGQTLRREWTSVCHRLDMPTRRQTDVEVYCRWTDMPQDTYRYSSAFTECLHPHPVMPLRSPGDRCVRVVCRAPQLRSGHRLVLTGAGRVLGEWIPTKGIPMTEHGYNEWVAEVPVDLLESQRMEFKFCIMQTDAQTPIWEVGDNRILQVKPQGGLTVYELDQSFYPLSDERVAGTLIPVFSLRTEGSFGVGDFGDLIAMIDFVASTGQRVLQVLPINDTTVNHTWTDSYPYSCISVFALHPQYADLRQLPSLANADRRDYYAHQQQQLNALQQIDYERVVQTKEEYLREIYIQEGSGMMDSQDYRTFFAENSQWLVPYALYCLLRDTYHTTDFARWHGHTQWNEAERTELSTPGSDGYRQVAYYYFVQYILHSQMEAAHSHARSLGVILKGDIPIGVHRQGCDVWTEPGYFCMDGQAGAPPDDFATDGQNWGFPTYNWQTMTADGCRWWNRRFTHMARYFDAYRIDHVLGFFRIWEIPVHAVRGLLGQFAPALAFTQQEIEGYGLHFTADMLTPRITADMLATIFGTQADIVRHYCLATCDDGTYTLRPEYNTECKIDHMIANGRCDSALRDGLFTLVDDVLFLADHRTPEVYHPRIAGNKTWAYRRLSDAERRAFDRLYEDFYYHRNNGFWYGEAMKKLPPLVEATHMLTCAEDLGMVPSCVAPVMEQLRILSLEIQTMPKTATRFADTKTYPYRSVCTFSSHDMAPLRQWWDEDALRTQDYYTTILHHCGQAPHPMPAELATEVLEAQLASPSMLCILSLQDWLAIDPQLRLADPNGERINIPANPQHYWRYRMHITIEQMAANYHFCSTVAGMISSAGRKLE